MASNSSGMATTGMKSGTVVIAIQMIDGAMLSRVGIAGIAEITGAGIVATEIHRDRFIFPSKKKNQPLFTRHDRLPKNRNSYF